MTYDRICRPHGACALDKGIAGKNVPLSYSLNIKIFWSSDCLLALMSKGVEPELQWLTGCLKYKTHPHWIKTVNFNFLLALAIEFVYVIMEQQSSQPVWEKNILRGILFSQRIFQCSTSKISEVRLGILSQISRISAGFGVQITLELAKSDLKIWGTLYFVGGGVLGQKITLVFTSTTQSRARNLSRVFEACRVAVMEVFGITDVAEG